MRQRRGEGVPLRVRRRDQLQGAVCSHIIGPQVQQQADHVPPERGLGRRGHRLELGHSGAVISVLVGVGRVRAVDPPPAPVRADGELPRPLNSQVVH